MSLSDKDAEALLVLGLLKEVEITSEQVQALFGDKRVTQGRVEKILERVKARREKLSAPFAKHKERKGL